MGGGWWVGGWVVCCNYSVYSGPDLLNLRLRLNWRGPGRHLKLTWRWSGPEFDNKMELLQSQANTDRELSGSSTLWRHDTGHGTSPPKKDISDAK